MKDPLVLLFILHYLNLIFTSTTTTTITTTTNHDDKKNRSLKPQLTHTRSCDELHRLHSH